MHNTIHLYGADSRFEVPDYIKKRLLATPGDIVSARINKRGGKIWSYMLSRVNGMELIELTIWYPSEGGIYRGMKPDDRVQNFPVWNRREEA